MIKWILIFLADLEKKIEKEEKLVVEKSYSSLKKELAPYKQAAPKAGLGGKIKAAFYNVGKVAKNAVDNTFGYGIASYQDYKTRKHFKKNPGSEDQVVYLMHGLFQNKGSQWRLAKDLRKEGFKPYHLKGYHHLPREKDADKAFEQIDKFHKYTKLKEPQKRNDYFSGHSSGADVGIYMAGDKRIRKYGITAVQARAPAAGGIEAKTLGQKLLMPFANEDNVKKSISAKKSAVTLADRKPKVPVYVVAGKYDNLVPPSDAIYKHAKKHYIIQHPDSTHFGTSGGTSHMNEVFIDLLKPKKAYKKAA
jgi:hypothetical protein